MDKYILPPLPRSHSPWRLFFPIALTICALVALPLVVGCHFWRTNAPLQTVKQTLVRCEGEALLKQALLLATDVSQVLVTGNTSGLDALVAQNGLDVVTCAVSAAAKHVQDKYAGSSEPAALPPEEVVTLKTADAWLHAQNVTVEGF